MRCSVYLFMAFLFLSFSVSAQQQRPQSPKPVALPADMDCEKLKGDKETPPSGSTILKGGTDYYLCKPKSETLLTRAKTAAVTVRSTQTITCGDGSSSDCLRQDIATVRQIEGLVDATDLWRYFEKAVPSKADIILQFIANDRANLVLHRLLLQCRTQTVARGRITNHEPSRTSKTMWISLYPPSGQDRSRTSHLKRGHGQSTSMRDGRRQTCCACNRTTRKGAAITTSKSLILSTLKWTSATFTGRSGSV